MSKILSIAFLVAGVVLVIYGINASNSAASGVSRAFTGTPTDKTVWLLVVGIVLGLVGLFGMFRGPRTPIT